MATTTELLAEASTLIDTFNTQKTAIDTAVAAAIAAVPDLTYLFYVDAVTGDNANNGSTTNKFQTLAHAMASCPVGSICYIVLTAGQTHVFDANVNNQAASIKITTSDNTVVTTILVDSYTYFDNVNSIGYNVSFSIKTEAHLALIINGNI